MPLNIVILGDGLVAAISLRQAGHTVLVLEKSALATEVGAALQLHPNAGRVLARLGFDLVRARACREHSWDVLKGTDLSVLSSMPLRKAPGYPEPGTFSVHRVDLHRELLRLATLKDEEVPKDANVAGLGPPVDIRLASKVRRVSEDGNGVLLESGEEVRGDLIVAADGNRSVVRSYVTQGEGKTVHSGLAAFRFLLESDKLRRDEELAALLDKAKDAVNLVADTTETERERHMLWYACQG